METSLQAEATETPTPPEVKSLESDRGQLLTTIDNQDKDLEGRLVVRIPTKDQREVLIFESILRHPSGDPHGEYSHAGVHPDEGAIFVTQGQLSSDIENIKRAQKTGVSIGLTKMVWEDMADISTATQRLDINRPKSEIVNVSPDKEEVWKNAYIASRSYAERMKRSEEAQRQVTPDLLEFVRNLPQSSEPITESPESTPEAVQTDNLVETSQPSPSEEALLPSPTPIEASTETPMPNTRETQPLREVPQSDQTP